MNVNVEREIVEIIEQRIKREKRELKKSYIKNKRELGFISKAYIRQLAITAKLCCLISFITIVCVHFYRSFLLQYKVRRLKQQVNGKNGEVLLK